MKYYFKATLRGGRSGYDPTYIHREGINKHPCPDKSKQICSAGVHLAISLEGARNYVENATEFYVAKPIGKIYGRDKTKIRVGEYHLWRIPADLLKVYDEAMAQAEKVREEALAQAKKVREEALAQAWKVRDEALQAWEVVYREAMAQAWKVYDEAMAQAWEVYKEATAQAQQNLIQEMRKRGILN